MTFPMNPNLSEEIYELTDDALKDPVANEVMKIPELAPLYCRKFSFWMNIYLRRFTKVLK